MSLTSLFCCIGSYFQILHLQCMYGWYIEWTDWHYRVFELFKTTGSICIGKLYNNENVYCKCIVLCVRVQYHSVLYHFNMLNGKKDLHNKYQNYQILFVVYGPKRINGYYSFTGYYINTSGFSPIIQRTFSIVRRKRG